MFNIKEIFVIMSLAPKSCIHGACGLETLGALND